MKEKILPDTRWIELCGLTRAIYRLLASFVRDCRLRFVSCCNSVHLALPESRCVCVLQARPCTRAAVWCNFSVYVCARSVLIFVFWGATATPLTRTESDSCVVLVLPPFACFTSAHIKRWAGAVGQVSTNRGELSGLPSFLHRGRAA